MFVLFITYITMHILGVQVYLFYITQRLQKLIYLHLPTDCFMKISL